MLMLCLAVVADTAAVVVVVNVFTVSVLVLQILLLHFKRLLGLLLHSMHYWYSIVRCGTVSTPYWGRKVRYGTVRTFG